MRDNYIPSLNINSDNISDATLGVCKEILNNGFDDISSKFSMNKYKPIKEIYNCSINILNPKKRIILPYNNKHYFDPSFASVRTLYILSGSSNLKQIQFYTKGANQFTDNGVTFPGSAYGNKIFLKKNNITNFERIKRLMEQRESTKRAYIPIFDDQHVIESEYTNDLPCAIGLQFMKRKNSLISISIMRANDALKVMPYNFFEFSIIGECLASALNIKHKSHIHTSMSMHLRDIGIEKAEKFIDLPFETQSTLPISSFNESLRQSIIKTENKIREKGRGISFSLIKSIIPKELKYTFFEDLLLASSLSSANLIGKRQSIAEEYLKYLENESFKFPLTINACNQSFFNN